MQTISPAIPAVSSQQARALIQDMDLFFLGGKGGPIDDAIRDVTDSWITHTGFFVRRNNAVFTLESTFTQGTHEGPGAGYLEGGDGPMVICRLAGITDADREALKARAYSLLGRPYEVGEEVCMALHRLWKAIPVHPEQAELFCSGFDQDVLAGSRWALPNDASGGNATPADVYATPFVVPVCAVRV